MWLNVKLLFESLKSHAKKDSDEIGKSISEFFMESCKCNRSINGFYQWKCVNQICKDCVRHETENMKGQNDEKLKSK